MVLDWINLFFLSFKSCLGIGVFLSEFNDTFPSLSVFGGQHFQLIKMESLKKGPSKADIIDEILKVLEVKKMEDCQSGPRLSGLLRCISSNAYRDMVLVKEDVKRKAKEHKENRKCEHEEA